LREGERELSGMLDRYLRSGREADLPPGRRGPKWKTRRMPAAIEAEVIAQRRLGLNRCEIYVVLRERRIIKDQITQPSRNPAISELANLHSQ
jgi:hypothetical protein